MKLDWKQANIREPITYRAAVAGSLDRLQWERVASQTWEFFLSVVVPLNLPGSWDVVRCEFWMDTGRLIIFVASNDHQRRIDNGVCELVVEEFANVWNRCADEHRDSDDLFVKALIEAQRQCAAPFVAALRRLVSREQSLVLSGRHVQFWNADSEEVLNLRG